MQHHTRILGTLLIAASASACVHENGGIAAQWAYVPMIEPPPSRVSDRPTSQEERDAGCCQKSQESGDAAKALAAKWQAPGMSILLTNRTSKPITIGQIQIRFANAGPPEGPEVPLVIPAYGTHSHELETVPCALPSELSFIPADRKGRFRPKKRRSVPIGGRITPSYFRDLRVRPECASTDNAVIPTPTG